MVAGSDMLDAIAEQVIAVIAVARRRSPETISMESSLAELGFDSLDTLTTVFDLESKFDISIPDEQAHSLRTVGDVVEGVRKLVADKAGHG
jgi:acyl carrier protein